jgi:hypothetical protein
MQLCLLPALLVCSSAKAQSNPCDLNNDGVVTYLDVEAAVAMVRGTSQCTADILGLDVCNILVLNRVSVAARSGVCITGDPATPRLSGLALSPNTVMGGQSGAGTISLSGNAGSGGVLVTLSSSDSSVAFPSTVTIPEGSASAGFTFVTSSESQTTTPIVTAIYSGVWATANLTVNAGSTLGLASFSVTPASLMSGQTAAGTVSLTGPAPYGGASIVLSSSSTAISFPGTVTIPSGAESADFTVIAGNVTTSTQAELSASYAGTSSSVSLTVAPQGVTLTWVASISPGIAGYNVFRGTVSGGPYTQMNSDLISGETYTDSTVQPGLTYFYVSTAVDSSNDQSDYSNETEVTVP